MRAIITVTESRSMHGRFKVQSSANKDRRGVILSADVTGAEAAAAQALEYAMRVGAVGYAIIAPASVSAHIPDDMRSRI
jgi:hypothetical protein